MIFLVAEIYTKVLSWETQRGGWCHQTNDFFVGFLAMQFFLLFLNCSNGPNMLVSVVGHLSLLYSFL